MERIIWAVRATLSVIGMISELPIKLLAAFLFIVLHPLVKDCYSFEEYACKWVGNFKIASFIYDNY